MFLKEHAKNIPELRKAKNFFILDTAQNHVNNLFLGLCSSVQHRCACTALFQFFKFMLPVGSVVRMENNKHTLIAILTIMSKNVLRTFEAGIIKIFKNIEPKNQMFL